MVLEGFSIFAVSMRGSKYHPKISPKITKNPLKILKISVLFVDFYFDSVQAHFLLHFGSILAPFGTILAQKNILFPNASPIHPFLSIFIDFGPHLGRFLDPRSSPRSQKIQFLTLFCIYFRFRSVVNAYLYIFLTNFQKCEILRMSSHICTYL